TRFVLEHEHRFRAREILALARFFISRSGRRSEARQENAERCALAQHTLGTDMTAALPDDAIARGQAEAAAVHFLSREKRLQKGGLGFRHHFRAVFVLA